MLLTLAKLFLLITVFFLIVCIAGIVAFCVIYLLLAAMSLLVDFLNDYSKNKRK